MRKFLDAGNLDDVIPRDYVHVFLIRDPVKAIPSFLKLASDMKLMPTGASLKLPTDTLTDTVQCKNESTTKMTCTTRKFQDVGANAG